MPPATGDLLSALSVLADLRFAGLIAAGVVVGVVVGAVPGLTATLAIALLLPFTFHMPPAEALVTLTGIYVGGIYGGSITAITVRIPGAPANTMTMLDGHAMARAGQAEAALGLATFSSVAGGLVGGFVLALFAPWLAGFALEFQSPETFALVVLALVAVATVSRGSMAKGLAATLLGLMLSTVGLDRMQPVPRFTMGLADLLVGVPLLPLVIGFFAVGEFLWQTGEPGAQPGRKARIRVKRLFDCWPHLKAVGWWLLAKSALLGALVGALPGGGGAMAAFLAYAEAKRSSRRPAAFGTGIAEGIVAPEAANNAMTGGALVPMLAFGIPGDAVTAVMLGGLLIQGITPGPQLFRDNVDVVVPVFLGYFVAYGVVLIVGFGLLPWYARLALVERGLLFPVVATVAVVAAFASERTVFGMGLTVLLGVAAYGLRRYGFPLVPVLLGFILGPMLESNFRRALVVSERGPLIFLQSPISAVLLAAAALLGWYFGLRQPRASSAAEAAK